MEIDIAASNGNTASARALMVLGTASHAGKSLLVAALCRIFAQDGLRVAPFKAQNMSLASAATPEGHEIGRAQAMQAEAAGIPASVDMNPVLLKPTSDRRSQVVVLGKIWQTLDAREYHGGCREELFPIVKAAFARLAHAYDMVVLEGAGSPAEINLAAGDIVNLRMAQAAEAPCILVGDIDRGGVFAALVGTLELLSPEDRRRIRGFIINKFRGDVSLLTSGITMIEERLGIPCLGVVPYLRDLRIDEEDSVGHQAHPRNFSRGNSGADRPLRIAVIDFPTLANATDFDALAAEPSVELIFTDNASAVAQADVVILPGSKSTLADLAWLRAQQLDRAILERRSTQCVVGICGGFQMLGTRITDPLGIEGGGDAEGLALLNVATELGALKITIPVTGRLAGTSLLGIPSPEEYIDIAGYEIHVGTSTRGPDTPSFAEVVRTDGTPVSDGARNASGDVFGTYIHGMFAGDRFRQAFLASARIRSGLPATQSFTGYEADRKQQYDRLADTVREALDLDAIRRIAGISAPMPA
ncbi:MAG TPA: cobyric acid synthase [Candidatus Baltobacteraceae bacterium]|jgi:adenosylcobyric acid synthase|nr:cobyric acid synthase [Candidatus Baltobacteraceae bacterium]